MARCVEFQENSCKSNLFVHIFLGTESIFEFLNCIEMQLMSFNLNIYIWTSLKLRSWLRPLWIHSESYFHFVKETSAKFNLLTLKCDSNRPKYSQQHCPIYQKSGVYSLSIKWFSFPNLFKVNRFFSCAHLACTLENQQPHWAHQGPVVLTWRDEERSPSNTHHAYG